MLNLKSVDPAARVLAKQIAREAEYARVLAAARHKFDDKRAGMIERATSDAQYRVAALIHKLTGITNNGRALVEGEIAALKTQRETLARNRYS